MLTAGSFLFHSDGAQGRRFHADAQKSAQLVVCIKKKAGNVCAVFELNARADVREQDRMVLKLGLRGGKSELGYDRALLGWVLDRLVAAS
jgi:hypothetical protein